MYVYLKRIKQGLPVRSGKGGRPSYLTQQEKMVAADSNAEDVGSVLQAMIDLKSDRFKKQPPQISSRYVQYFKKEFDIKKLKGTAQSEQRRTATHDPRTYMTLDGAILVKILCLYVYACITYTTLYDLCVIVCLQAAERMYGVEDENFNRKFNPRNVVNFDESMGYTLVHDNKHHGRKGSTANREHKNRRK